MKYFYWKRFWFFKLIHFYFQEPEVEFQAESQFEGKNLPQLTSLITNHLRKSIQKKHTLPNYKVRYNPFFEQPSPQDETQEVYVHDSLVTVGALDVTVVGCTRLPELENWALQYCTLSVDMLPWGRLAKNRRAMWPTFEVRYLYTLKGNLFHYNMNKNMAVCLSRPYALWLQLAYLSIHPFMCPFLFVFTHPLNSQGNIFTKCLCPLFRE